MSISDSRKDRRVKFERGFEVFLMAIDGTWRRNCILVDVSQTGAKLMVEGSIEGLQLKEFFLLLTSTGSRFISNDGQKPKNPAVETQ